MTQHAAGSRPRHGARPAPKPDLDHTQPFPRQSAPKRPAPAAPRTIAPGQTAPFPRMGMLAESSPTPRRPAGHAPASRGAAMRDAARSVSARAADARRHSPDAGGAAGTGARPIAYPQGDNSAGAAAAGPAPAGAPAAARPAASAGAQCLHPAPPQRGAIARLRRLWLQSAAQESATPAQSRTDAALASLSALAVVAVVLGTAFPDVVPGGFLGTTLLLAVAGFTATRGIERELGRTGGFSYASFLGRRAARLLPAVLVLIALTALGTALLAPGLMPAVRADALPDALFLGNWADALDPAGASGLPSPLANLWLTGAVMQFYVVWPPVLLAIAHGIRRREHALGLIGGLMLASALVMTALYGAGDGALRAFLGTDARAAELLAGAGAALALPLLLSWYRRADQAEPAGAPALSSPAALLRALLSPDACTSIGCICALVLCAGLLLATRDSAFAYRGGLLFMALVSALLIICVQQPESGLTRLLSARPLAAASRRALSLYLVHYPVLCLMGRTASVSEQPWWQTLLQVVAVIVATEAFWRLVDRPCRDLADRLLARAHQAPRVAMSDATQRVSVPRPRPAKAKPHKRGEALEQAGDKGGAGTLEGLARKAAESAAGRRLAGLLARLPRPRYLVVLVAASAVTVVALAISSLG